LLFGVQAVQVKIPEENLPGFRSPRVFCDHCGEGINLRREVRLAGRTLCIPCARLDGRPMETACASRKGPAKVLHVVGFKKVGKTTLIEKLVGELTGRGYRVGTIKHHHSEFPAEVDCAGTDSWRHRRAGAQTVALMTPAHVALFCDAGDGASLEKVLPHFDGHDLVLVEGLHGEPGPKIEVLSQHHGARICGADNHSVIATVGAIAPAAAVPSFTPDRIEPLANFIAGTFLIRAGAEIASAALPA